MTDPLSKLVANLTKEDISVAKKLYAINNIKDDEQINILSQKNIFPYIGFDSYDRFKVKSLPEEKYFNTLAQRGLKHISCASFLFFSILYFKLEFMNYF